MAGGIMTNEIKELHAVSLKADRSLWEQIASEVHTLLPKVQNDTLTSDDIKNVQGLVAHVKQSSTDYNRYLNGLMAGYKAELQQNLNAIGYPVIEQYVVRKRTAQQQEVNRRIAEKNELFQQYVNNALLGTLYIHNSTLRNHLISFMHPLFPKLSSGAESKMMTERDWANVHSVVNNLVRAIDSTMNPVIAQLPLHSQTMKLYVDVLRTADISKLHNIQEAIAEDRMFFIELILTQKLQTEDDVLGQIAEVINSESTDKISQIQFILDIWKKAGK